ncbi:hypothetical protein GW17_00005349 [Ensete ventricosum]|nr:hypothetical protein GW17_00005349 [Ensete ventricosum]
MTSSLRHWFGSARTKVCNFDLYRPIRAVHTGPPGYRYADHPVPLKIDRRQSISIVGDRLKKKLTVSGRLRKKKGRRRGKEKKKKRRRKNTSPSRRPCPPAVVARGSPAAVFSFARETERLPMRGERLRRRTIRGKASRFGCNIGPHRVNCKAIGRSSSVDLAQVNPLDLS